MSWFRFTWSEKDDQLLNKWRGECGKNIKFIDETRPDPQADEISYVFGVPIYRDVYTSKIPIPVKSRKPRKSLSPFERQLIFELNGKICSDCGQIEGLQIHYIDEDPSNNELSNLILLCYLCHKKRHKVRVIL